MKARTNIGYTVLTVHEKFHHLQLVDATVAHYRLDTADWRFCFEKLQFPPATKMNRSESQHIPAGIGTSNLKKITLRLLL